MRDVEENEVREVTEFLGEVTGEVISREIHGFKFYEVR